MTKRLLIGPVRGGARGDLLCRIKIETPVNLNSEQKALFKQLGESLSGAKKHSPQHHSWMDTIKSFFDKED